MIPALLVSAGRLDFRMSVYVCDVCNYRYDESKEEIPWDDLPEDWVCPLCGVGKDKFSLLDEDSGKEKAGDGGHSGEVDHSVPVTVSDVLAETMVAWGVRWVFGMLGHSNLGMGEAVRKQEEKGKLNFVSIRHEGAASFACSAYGKLTRRLSACLTIAGPGATNLLTGLWDANLDRSPVLAVTGQVEAQVLGPGGFQEVDLQAAFGRVAAWQQTVLAASNYGELMSLACKNSLTGRRVSHLVVPDEIQKLESRDQMMPGNPEGRMMAMEIGPPVSSVKKAADLLGQSKRPAIIAGYGALPVAQSVVELAEEFSLPVITTYKAKGLLSDNHPLACGVVGRSGTPVAAKMMAGSDCLLVLGAGFSAHSGILKTIPTIQVDFDAAALARFHSVNVPVWGEIGITLSHLKARLSKTVQFEDRRRDIAENWDSWRREKRKRAAHVGDKGISSAAVYDVLTRTAPGDSLMTIDVGDNAYTFGRYFESDRQPVIMSGYLGSIGFSFPAAMGVWAASQEEGSEFAGRKVISVSGDGGFAQYMGEFLTAVKYDMDITHLLLNNNELGKISREQQDEDFQVWNTSLVNVNFAEFAESCGASGYRAETAEELEKALERAIDHPGPALVEVSVDSSLH